MQYVLMVQSEFDGNQTNFSHESKQIVSTMEHSQSTSIIYNWHNYAKI